MAQIARKTARSRGSEGDHITERPSSTVQNGGEMHKETRYFIKSICRGSVGGPSSNYDRRPISQVVIMAEEPEEEELPKKVSPENFTVTLCIMNE